MPVDVNTTIEIDVPVERVAAYACDPDNAPEWYANIQSIEWETPPPLQLGSRMAFVAHFLGRRMAYTYEVVELVHNELLVMRTAQGPFPMETRYTFEDLGDGRTRMGLRNLGEPAGFSRLMTPMMVPAMRRANEADLVSIKGILESREG